MVEEIDWAEPLEVMRNIFNGKNERFYLMAKCKNKNEWVVIAIYNIKTNRLTIKCAKQIAAYITSAAIVDFINISEQRYLEEHK